MCKIQGKTQFDKVTTVKKNIKNTQIVVKGKPQIVKNALHIKLQMNKIIKKKNTAIQRILQKPAKTVTENVTFH